MHINTECITIRIFSGVHLGAEISLCAGSYVIGRDKSCDIILQDQSIEARHIQLNVTCIHLTSNTPNDDKETAYRVEVSVQNLDGTISHEENILENNATVLMQRPYMLGQVCFAWFKYGEPENITHIQDELQNKILNHTKFNTTITNDIDTSTSDNLVGTNVNNEGNQQQDNLTMPITPPSKPWRRYIMLAMIFLLLLGITLTIKDKIQTSYNNKILLEKTLAEKNFPSLSVDEQKGMVSVQGLLSDDIEFSRLTALVQNMHFPVYLNVNIQSDVIPVIIKELNLRGLYPLMDVHAEKKEIIIRMYLKDKLIFNGLSMQINDLFPIIRAYKITYNIHYADKISALLNQKIDVALNQKVVFEFLPGIIKIVGNLSNDEFINIKNIIDEISDELDIPIVYDYIKRNIVQKTQQEDKKSVAQDNNVPKTAKPLIVKNNNIPKNDTPMHITPRFAASPQSNKEKSIELKLPIIIYEQAAKQELPVVEHQADINLGVEYEFKVTSVNLSPIKYIILANEQRVFLGGLLPGGYTLIGIELDELTLEKDNVITTYYLHSTNN